MWLELVAHARMVTLHGRPLVPFMPFEIKAPLSAGANQALHVEFSRECLIVATEGGVLVNGRVVPQGETFGVDDATGGKAVMLRVVGLDPANSCGWPDDVVPPQSVPDDDGLRVFGDQLLERGHAVGHRFIAREPRADVQWLGAIPAEAVLRWRVGIVDALQLTTVPFVWSTMFALRRTAITRVMRSLTLASASNDHVLEALEAQGGLPWLEELSVHFRRPRGRRGTPSYLRSRTTWRARNEALVARVAAAMPALTHPPNLTFSEDDGP